MGQRVRERIVFYEGINGIVDGEELFDFLDMTPEERYQRKIKLLQREIK